MTPEKLQKAIANGIIKGGLIVGLIIVALIFIAPLLIPLILAWVEYLLNHALASDRGGTYWLLKLSWVVLALSSLAIAGFYYLKNRGRTSGTITCCIHKPTPGDEEFRVAKSGETVKVMSLIMFCRSRLYKNSSNRHNRGLKEYFFETGEAFENFSSGLVSLETLCSTSSPKLIKLEFGADIACLGEGVLAPSGTDIDLKLPEETYGLLINALLSGKGDFLNIRMNVDFKKSRSNSVEIDIKSLSILETTVFSESTVAIGWRSAHLQHGDSIKREFADFSEFYDKQMKWEADAT